MTPPKTERFEMRMEEDILASIDQWRSEQDDVPTRTEAVRRLIERGLAGSRKEGVSFTDGEKLIVIMLRDLYKHLKLSRGEIDPDFVAEVIWGGHYWAPKWDMDGLFHDGEDKASDVRFVVNVLNMWTFIERAYEKLSKKEKDRLEKEADPFGKDPKFYGFDGNNESSLMSIATFFVEKMGRWTNFKGREMNSHMPTVHTYARMYEKFAPMYKTIAGRNLSVDELIELLAVKKYPE